MEVKAPTILKCKCCPRHFDSLHDICQVDGCGMCRSCHRTAYGVQQPHEFQDPDMLRPDAKEQLAEVKGKK